MCHPASKEDALYWKVRAGQLEKALAEERALRKAAQLLVMKLKANACHPVRCEDCWIAWAAKEVQKHDGCNGRVSGESLTR